jgi:hypothetical protein
MIEMDVLTSTVRSACTRWVLWTLRTLVLPVFDRTNVGKRDAIPTGTVRWVDLDAGKIIRLDRRVGMTTRLWLGPIHGLELRFVLTTRHPTHVAKNDDAVIVEVEMDDGRVECRKRDVSYMHGVGVHRHAILAFFSSCIKGGDSGDSTDDISTFLNARLDSRLQFADVVALAMAHGLLGKKSIKCYHPRSLCVVLTDLSERVYVDGDIVHW